jgi:hypothetical protein
MAAATPTPGACSAGTSTCTSTTAATTTRLRIDRSEAYGDEGGYQQGPWEFHVFLRIADCGLLGAMRGDRCGDQARTVILERTIGESDDKHFMENRAQQKQGLRWPREG